MKVKVYFNLHKKCFSVQHRGMVIAHRDKLILANVTFKVSQAGRARVLKTRHKNVHAYVAGNWYAQDYTHPGVPYDRVTYNPYLYDNFVKKSDKSPVTQAKMAWWEDREILIPQNP